MYIMLNKTQYKLLIEDYMITYDISDKQARYLINKHKMYRYVESLKNDIIENFNLSLI